MNFLFIFIANKFLEQKGSPSNTISAKENRKNNRIAASTIELHQKSFKHTQIFTENRICLNPVSIIYLMSINSSLNDENISHLNDENNITLLWHTLKRFARKL